MNGRGFLSAYGSYEKYYETTLLKSTPSTSIAWVGTLQGVVLIRKLPELQLLLSYTVF